MTDLDKGASLGAAARAHNIPVSSFRDHAIGKTKGRKRVGEGVLTEDEESQLVAYVMDMQRLGWLLNVNQLKLKVAQICEGRDTPFVNGVPSNGWLKWFRKRHQQLSLRTMQGLEQARAYHLCEQNVRSFYVNLEEVYKAHSYTPDRIWNCDESGANASRSGNGLVIARKGCRNVHAIVPDEREWLSVLACVNAAGQHVPNFYILRGKRVMRNYIEQAKSGATMAMQPKAWMTSYLFAKWIEQFILCIKRRSSISASERHLLILDGHGSHVTLEVVLEAQRAGLDLLTLPSHTSHALQPLDLSVFKPFKTYFRKYRDMSGQ